jgi:hypothetical protein
MAVLALAGFQGWAMAQHDHVEGAGYNLEGCIDNV